MSHAIAGFNAADRATASFIANKIARGEFVDESPDGIVWAMMRGSNMAFYNAMRRAMFAASVCMGNRQARVAAFRRELSK